MTLIEVKALNGKVIRYRHEGVERVGKVEVLGEPIFNEVLLRGLAGSPRATVYHLGNPCGNKISQELAEFEFLGIVAETPTPEMVFHR